jgi:long-chain acyl-CoA synthetase
VIGDRSDRLTRAPNESGQTAAILRGPGAVGVRGLVEWINARVARKFQRVTDVMIVDDFPRLDGQSTL